MARISLMRDERYGSICLRFNHNSTHTYRTLPVKVAADQWADGKVINHLNAKTLNATLQSILSRANVELMRLQESEHIRQWSVAELRDRICQVVLNEEQQKPQHDFFKNFRKYILTHTKRSTQVVYETTLHILEAYAPNLTFEDVTKQWLEDFDAYMVRRGASVNYKSIQERNIRAFFNWAIDHDLTTNYPFRRFSIKSEAKEARDLSPEQLRQLFTHTFCPSVQRYVDFFRLQTYLLGINIADMYTLKKSDVRRGRLHYVRHKTGKIYSIKIEPEAAALLTKYKGAGDNLLAFVDNWTAKTPNGFTRQLNDHLERAAKELGWSIHLTSYVSRYSVASIMYNDLNVPVDIISQALGHSFGLKVTQGYIRQDTKKVDEANRKFLDLIKA